MTSLSCQVSTVPTKEVTPNLRDQYQAEIQTRGILDLEFFGPGLGCKPTLKKAYPKLLHNDFEACRLDHNMFMQTLKFMRKMTATVIWIG